MKIRSVQLKEIGVFQNETIKFQETKQEGAEIHIFTGQNGTGKTTLLQTLATAIYVAYDSSHRVMGFDFDKTTLCKKFISRNSKGTINFDNELDIEIEIIFKLVGKAELKNSILGFAYSGYRFIEHEENIDLKDRRKYNPLINALEFIKNSKYDTSVNQWIANRISQRNNAFFENSKDEIEKYNKGIETLKQIIEEIIESPIDFKLKTEQLKVVVVRDGIEQDFDTLPDGLRSIISWLGDLIMRIDSMKWDDEIDVFKREFILLLDEIEVHLHPYWQRKILPVLQKKFVNAQIFLTTHSPFIVNSIDGAWIYELDLIQPNQCHVTKIKESNTSNSYQTEIREIFEISRFSEAVENELHKFSKLRDDILLQNKVDEKVFLKKAANLASKNEELKSQILFELRQLSLKTGKEYVL